jgi:HK97 gp10 family phage protein
MSRITATARIVVGNVPGLLAKVGGGLWDGVGDAAVIVEGAAKQNCPVDTGALRDSIATQMYRGAEAAQRGGSLASSLFSVVAEISPDMPYSVYVEFGTGRRGAASPGAGPFEYKESWPGQVAQPYMRPAADDNRDAAVEAIKSAVQSALS